MDSLDPAVSAWRAADEDVPQAATLHRTAGELEDAVATADVAVKSRC